MKWLLGAIFCVLVVLVPASFCRKTTAYGRPWVVPIEETLIFDRAVGPESATYTYEGGGDPPSNKDKPGGRAYCVERDVAGSCEERDFFPTVFTCTVEGKSPAEGSVSCASDVDYMMPDDMNIYCASEDSTDAVGDCALFFTVERFYTVMAFVHVGSTLSFVLLVVCCTVCSKGGRREVQSNIRYITGTCKTVIRSINRDLWQ